MAAADRRLARYSAAPGGSSSAAAAPSTGTAACRAAADAVAVRALGIVAREATACAAAAFAAAAPAAGPVTGDGSAAAAATPDEGGVADVDFPASAGGAFCAGMGLRCGAAPAPFRSTTAGRVAMRKACCAGATRFPCLVGPPEGPPDRSRSPSRRNPPKTSPCGGGSAGRLGRSACFTAGEGSRGRCKGLSSEGCRSCPAEQRGSFAAACCRSRPASGWAGDLPDARAGGLMQWRGRCRRRASGEDALERFWGVSPARAPEPPRRLSGCVG